MDVMVRGLSDMRPRTFGGEEVVVEVEVEEKCRRRDVSLKDAREPGAPSAATDENGEAAGQHGLNSHQR